MRGGEGRRQGKHVHGQGQTQEEKQHNMTGIDGKRGSGILKQKRKKRTQRGKAERSATFQQKKPFRKT